MGRVMGAYGTPPRHRRRFGPPRPPLARFRAAALDGYAVAPYDEAEPARLRALGIDGPEGDPTVLLEPTDGGPRLWVQRVPEPKRVQNRLHLDLSTPNPTAEPARLAALGATVSARHDDHAVLLNLEDNQFCVTEA